MLGLFWLLLTTLLGWARPRQDLVLENLVLRHQVAVLSRPTRNPTTRSASHLGQTALGAGSPLVCRLDLVTLGASTDTGARRYLSAASLTTLMPTDSIDPLPAPALLETTA